MPFVTRSDDHWKELTERRISRADKLTLSWRDGEIVPIVMLLT